MIPLLWFTLGLVVGFAFLLLVEFVLLLKYWATFESNTIDKKPYIEPQLPPELKDFVRAHPRPLPHQRDEIPTEKCEAVNFLLSFIFKELRDTVPVRRYFLRMLTANFKRLLNTTSVGKVIKRARVQDLDLGKCMPHIGGVTVVRPKNSKFEDQQEVDLAVDVAYKGNWHLTIAADLVFNKSATVSVTVLELTGKLRLALRHFPVPHYSVSFYEEPNLRLEVESVFEGKDVSQLNSIIANQIRRSIRRNWTLPAGKMRFKPLFQQPTEDAEPVVTMFGKPLFVGDLTIEVVGAIDLTTRRSGTDCAGRLCPGRCCNGGCTVAMLSLLNGSVFLLAESVFLRKNHQPCAQVQSCGARSVSRTTLTRTTLTKPRGGQTSPTK
eukprot:m.201597 g.201597  ORF g.201597 m.201597 type:complete len:380 (+) comp18424_c0_seq2:491-1630(+)